MLSWNGGVWPRRIAVSLHEIVIDDRTWEEAPEARRREWEAAIRELVDSGDVTIRGDARRMRVGVTEQATVLELYDEHEHPVSSVSIPRDALADRIAEYVDIVRQIASQDAAGASRLEALDMAKKVVHDRGGRVVRRHCREFDMDLATARRVFTLILCLRVDTTRLVGVHGHRRVR